MFLIAVVQTKVMNCNSANKNCVLQVVQFLSSGIKCIQYNYVKAPIF